MIDYDLETSPLQIRTNSLVGSNEELYIGFFALGFTDDENPTGGVQLFFTSPPQYRLDYCSSSNADFPTDLPIDTDKIWTIFLSKFYKLNINCNDKEVLNVVLSDTICDRSDWNIHWYKDVEKIKFSKSDTASDYYRPGKGLIFSLDVV